LSDEVVLLGEIRDLLRERREAVDAIARAL
jgi:hypothetical protein